MSLAVDLAAPREFEVADHRAGVIPPASRPSTFMIGSRQNRAALLHRLPQTPWRAAISNAIADESTIVGGAVDERNLEIDNREAREPRREPSTDSSPFSTAGK